MKTQHARSSLAVLALMSASVLTAGPVAGQSPSWEGTRDAALSLSVMKPNFEDGGFSFATAAMNLGGRIHLSESTLLVADIPFARGGIDEAEEFGGAASSSTIGNPYVGIELRRPSGWSWAVGGRIPLQHEFGEDDYATLIGIIGDIDRSDAYLSKVMALSGSARYDVRTPDGFTARFQLGPIVDVPFGDEADMEDPEVMAAYTAMLGYASSALELSAGWVGRALMTESDLEDGERSIDHLVAELAIGSARVQPVIGVRRPLDDIGIGSVIAIGVRIR
jgi:hypothetical protein